MVSDPKQRQPQLPEGLSFGPASKVVGPPERRLGPESAPERPASRLRALKLVSSPLEVEIVPCIGYTIITGGHDGPGSDIVLPPREKSRISSLPEFQAHAAENQWNTRKARGVPHHAGVLDFIRDTYGPWIEKCKVEGIRFTQFDLRKVDRPLYDRFQQATKNVGIPEWLHLPTEKEAVLNEITDPAERERLLRARALSAESTRLRRQRHD